MNIPKLVSRLDSNARLIISVGAAAITFITMYGKGEPSIHLMTTWIVFSLFHLGFSWISILYCDAADIPKLVNKQDAGRTVTFISILVATLASLLAVVLLFSETKTLRGIDLVTHIVLSITSVFCSWWLLHTNFIFKYAHLYYITKPEEPGKNSNGLEFPQTEKPGYWDFTYYSFVIGTTFQVSDVSICSTRIRKIVWLHSLFSFGFNTTIIALTINIISGLIK